MRFNIVWSVLYERSEYNTFQTMLKPTLIMVLGPCLQVIELWRQKPRVPLIMAERLCVSTNWRRWILMVGGPRFKGKQDEVSQPSRCRSTKPKSKTKCFSNLVSPDFEDSDVTNMP